MSPESSHTVFPLDAGCCKIRPCHWEDCDQIARLANNWQIAKNVRDIFPHPYSLQNAEAWLRHLEQQHPTTNFAIEVAGQYAGGIGLQLQDDVHRRSAEIGYWLGEEYWGHGIATAAVKVFTRFGFQQFNLLRIYASVYSWNPASMRVLEKAGYIREGLLRQSVVKQDQILDSALYAFTRDMLPAQ